MNWKVFKKSYKILCFICGFYLAERFCHSQTDGFALSKIAHCMEDNIDLPFNPAFLQQHFSYYAKGAQCYVFIGDDRQTILKLFRSSRYQLRHLMHELLPFIPDKQDLAIKKTIESYQWAAKYFSKESALLGTHLGSETPLSLDYLKIVDKLGIVHTILLKDTPFILQAKATLVKDKIRQLMNEKNPEGAKTALKNITALLKKQRTLGKYDADANLSKNFGFIGEVPIHIDVGRLQPGPAEKQTKLLASKEDLQHWLNNTYPELAKDFEIIFQEYLESNEL